MLYPVPVKLCPVVPVRLFPAILEEAGSNMIEDMEELEELDLAVSKPDELAEDNPGLPREAFDLLTILLFPV